MEEAVLNLILQDYEHEFAIVMVTAILTALISSLLVEPIAKAFLPGSNGLKRWKSVIFFVSNMLLLWLFYFGFKPVDDHNYAEWAFLTFVISALSALLYSRSTELKGKVGQLAFNLFGKDSEESEEKENGNGK